MNEVYKKCECCNIVYFTVQGLIPLGVTKHGAWFNCPCGSTMLIKHKVKEEMDMQELTAAEQEKLEEEIFIEEHMNWGRI